MHLLNMQSNIYYKSTARWQHLSDAAKKFIYYNEYLLWFIFYLSLLVHCIISVSPIPNLSYLVKQTITLIGNNIFPLFTDRCFSKALIPKMQRSNVQM